MEIKLINKHYNTHLSILVLYNMDFGELSKLLDENGISHHYDNGDKKSIIIHTNNKDIERLKVYTVHGPLMTEIKHIYGISYHNYVCNTDDLINNLHFFIQHKGVNTKKAA